MSSWVLVHIKIVIDNEYRDTVLNNFKLRVIVEHEDKPIEDTGKNYFSLQVLCKGPIFSRLEDKIIDYNDKKYMDLSLISEEDLEVSFFDILDKYNGSISGYFYEGNISTEFTYDIVNGLQIKDYLTGHLNS